MIKKTLCFSNPAYLSLRDAQLVIKLPEVEKADNLTEAFKKADGIIRFTYRDKEGHQGIYQVSKTSHSGRIYHVPVFHLHPALCQHGKC